MENNSDSSSAGSAPQSRNKNTSKSRLIESRNQSIIIVASGPALLPREESGCGNDDISSIFKFNIPCMRAYLSALNSERGATTQQQLTVRGWTLFLCIYSARREKSSRRAEVSVCVFVICTLAAAALFFAILALSSEMNYLAFARAQEQERFEHLRFIISAALI